MPAMRAYMRVAWSAVGPAAAATVAASVMPAAAKVAIPYFMITSTLDELP
jgi:hypothetical protein